VVMVLARSCVCRGRIRHGGSGVRGGGSPIRGCVRGGGRFGTTRLLALSKKDCDTARRGPSSSPCCFTCLQ